MEAAAVESISKALGLPRPFLHEPNRAFTQVESWQQLTALLATQPVRIKPLGYYRTPDSVEMYVLHRFVSVTLTASQPQTVTLTYSWGGGKRTHLVSKM